MLHRYNRAWACGRGSGATRAMSALPVVLLVALAASGCARHASSGRAGATSTSSASVTAKEQSTVPSNQKQSNGATIQKVASNELWAQGYNNRYIPVVDEFEQHL